MRQFAGLNILMSGDVWQLPPADGGFLGDIPYEYIENSRRYAPAPSISHGQSLVWSDRESGAGIHGVTELTECERTKDKWLKHVQDEFRIGKLFADRHAFLHGKPSLVPGSTICGKAKCKSQWCRARAAEMAGKESLSNIDREEMALPTLDMECPVCSLDRKRDFSLQVRHRTRASHRTNSRQLLVFFQQ